MQTIIVTEKQSFKTHYEVASPITTTTEKPPSGAETSPEATPALLPPDVREQLFNGGEVGPIEHIQVSTERIVQLNGIFFDLDPTSLREGPLLPGLSQDPQEFYDNCLRRWLANHPLLHHLEVRASGTGLHAILRLNPPVEF